jgi:hypothetical protein
VCAASARTWRSTQNGDLGTWNKVSPPELENTTIFRMRVDPGGTHDVYQLLLGVGSNGGDDAVIDDVRGVTVYDAFADPRACELLGGLLREGAEVHGEHARVEFHWLEGVEPPDDLVHEADG